MVPKAGRIWIQGAGELASGVAVRLVRCGYEVIMAEVARPLAVRRLVSFAEAVFSGHCEVEGIPGRLVAGDQVLFRPAEVQVVIDPGAENAARLGPDAIVDGRLTKRRPEALPIPAIPVLGLGPGFRCGVDAACVVETHRHARLGALLTEGEAAPDTGVPGLVGGQSARRLLRSPGAGRLRPQAVIGELVSAGQTVGQVGDEPLKSSIDGMLRGLIHSEVELFAGQKVGDVDPRGAEVNPALVSDKALAVAGGVLEGLLRLGIRPGQPARRIDTREGGGLS